MTFDPVTPEFTLLTITPFATIRHKSAYHAKYLRISWTYLDLLYRSGRRIQGRRSLWDRRVMSPQYLWRGTSMVMSPNILEVTSFKMSTRVSTRCLDPQGKWMTYLLYFSAWKVESEKYVFKCIFCGCLFYPVTATTVVCCILMQISYQNQIKAGWHSPQLGGRSISREGGMGRH